MEWKQGFTGEFMHSRYNVAPLAFYGVLSARTGAYTDAVPQLFVQFWFHLTLLCGMRRC